MKRSIRTTALTTGALLLALALPTAPAIADEPAPRIDLRVLVVTDGGPATAAIAAELDAAGTPYTLVDLGRSDRPVIGPAFLADTVDGRPRAKFQAVVLPNDNPFQAGSPEMAALVAYEQAYGIPQVDAYTYARPQAGLEVPNAGGYSGSVDGIRAQVTPAGNAGPFGYLDGEVPFEDNAPDVGESYAFLSRPRAGADFTTYVDAPIPGSTARGSLVGEYRHDGRRELVVTFVYNQYQQQFRLLARGIVDWMTQEVHLGASRNYFSVHVDDVFGADDRWDPLLNCTPGDVDCPPGQGTQNPIRMSAADVRNAADWSRRRGFTLDLAYNGAGSEQHRVDNDGADPAADEFLARRADFRWLNHTYDHAFLGCEQDVSVVPWKCATNADGSTRYVGRTEISREISDNRQWGERAGLPQRNDELVTGEHSGLRVLPQQPDDNPNLAPALADNGVAWLASDNSRDPGQRAVGSALTVARYPINIFYNAGRTSEQVDEYNWLYTSRAQGGSGLCEELANTTCLDAPLDTATGYADHIVPLETSIALGHVLGNDPRPHFMHQSNLAEDRIGYPVLDAVLDRYAALHADNTPLVNPRMSDVGEELRKRNAWNAAVRSGAVTAFRIGGTVTVQAPQNVAVPAGMPTGTTQSLPAGSTGFGQPYAGTVSGWVSRAAGQDRVTLVLPPALVPAADPGHAAVADRAAGPAGRAARHADEPSPGTAPRTPVPAGVLRAVRPGTGY
ncbi:hypothetical protein KQY30_03770 [Streptomyces sp. GMY02]|uniref:hypothetical protein n=1 Tax=Streptomyces sp. GMY02 TaxID=1333528 RepID=UPI001C2B9AA7|nr:hypothetical protein [Streptomyces sp. GMY02]QXE33537.1 hypothetical protein KQY30_03770 [Streptomyces sp. GMY02]